MRSHTHACVLVRARTLSYVRAIPCAHARLLRHTLRNSYSPVTPPSVQWYARKCAIVHSEQPGTPVALLPNATARHPSRAGLLVYRGRPSRGKRSVSPRFPVSLDGPPVSAQRACEPSTALGSTGQHDKHGMPGLLPREREQTPPLRFRRWVGFKPTAGELGANGWHSPHSVGESLTRWQRRNPTSLESNARRVRELGSLTRLVRAGNRLAVSTLVGLPSLTFIRNVGGNKG
jgi:hypothetical protein